MTKSKFSLGLQALIFVILVSSLAGACTQEIADNRTRNNNPNSSLGEKGQDDHGDSAEEATALTHAQNRSGILADQQDIDVFAWLASEPGAYRVTVKPYSGNNIQAILSFQEVATVRLKRSKEGYQFQACGYHGGG